MRDHDGLDELITMAGMRSIRSILLIVDRARFYRLEFTVRQLDANVGNVRQIIRFAAVNRRVAGSSPA